MEIIKALLKKASRRKLNYATLMLDCYLMFLCKQTFFQNRVFWKAVPHFEIPKLRIELNEPWFNLKLGNVNVISKYLGLVDHWLLRSITLTRSGQEF